MPRPKVLVLYLSELAYVARVLRQIEFLASDFEVVVAAFDRPRLPGGTRLIELTGGNESALRSRVESVIRAALRLVGAYRPAYWFDGRVRSWRRQLRDAGPVDAVVVNELFAIPLGLAVAAGAPVVFDAHEHWTSESASWTRRQRMSMRGAHEWLVDRVPQTAGVMTVSVGIRQDYERRTGILPALVTNAPPFQPLEPSPVEEPIRLLHFGMADERRRLEDTIEAVSSHNGRFTLDVVLRGDNAYRRRLERLAAARPGIRILPPVANEELLAFANAYDVGVFLLPARFPNQVHVLPNKLFDYIQARLAVAIGPSPEMAAIVNEWGCGVVSASFEAEDFAATLGDLTVETVERMKQNADRAAQVLTAERNRATVLELVRSAIVEAGGGAR